jgi:uncharacterized protein
LNALVAGCNQKTSRDPVLNATEAEVQEALGQLKRLSMVIEVSGHRVTRFDYNLTRVLQVPSQSVAILTTLMLRGPQTPGELRLNSERLHKFLDISSVEAFLHELRERSAGALVVELPRRPGARENRWAHLLSGEIDLGAHELNAATTPIGEQVSSSEMSALKQKVEILQEEVAELKATVAKLCSELGLETP